MVATAVLAAETGPLEAAARDAAAACGDGTEGAVLLRMGGRRADGVAELIASGDFARAAEDLRAAAEYIEIAAALGRPALCRAA